MTIALLTRFQEIWDSITKVPLQTNQWEGWLLNLLSRRCFNNLSQRMNKTDPFKPILFKKPLNLYNLFNDSNKNEQNICGFLKI